ncbi:MAG: 2-oxo acid dehydrogenase subunit E2 [Methylibium sp.]|nr:2-oxo acid dehydrogenase subunit E2 [Methylibium sp.]
MADFLMPALGADMETGKVVQWLVQAGDRIKSGDVVAVVETHKGAIDVECFLDGVIEALVPLDTALPVGAVLARVRGAAGMDATRPAAPPASAPASTPTAAPLKAAPSAAVERPVPPAAPPPASEARKRISPAARRRARELGLVPDTLAGHGADGAVTLADVEAAALAAPAPRATRAGFDPAQMRQAIAAAMSRSKREIPHYYLSTTVDFTAAQAWLERYNAGQPPEQRLLPAVLLLKAVALALRRWPQLNGFYEGAGFRPGPGVHIGWAIALRGGGLVAPAIHNADRLSLAELMTALRDLVQRARSGGLRSSELSDPTITVTSLGERGAESVLGVIYPPQVAIIGFGRVLLRPWVVDGQVLARPLLNLSLAADHRASDGHLGGQALALIDEALQAPDSL